LISTASSLAWIDALQQLGMLHRTGNGYGDQNTSNIADRELKSKTLVDAVYCQSQQNMNALYLHRSSLPETRSKPLQVPELPTE